MDTRDLEIIRETIVVEGKDDEAAVKKAVRCNIITTHGFGIKERTFEQIRIAAEKTGVIVLTDPDFAGDRIRERIDKRVKGCKHAFLSRENATLNGNVGVENASPENIKMAIKNVRTVKTDPIELIYTKEMLVTFDLVGGENAAVRRAKMGDILRIGYGNGKQFLQRLNYYGISREAFYDALKSIEAKE